jgi:hypothetical protein
MSCSSKITTRTITHQHLTGDIIDLDDAVNFIVNQATGSLTTILSTNSANWDLAYNYSTVFFSNSANFITFSLGDNRYVNLSGDIMTGGLSAPSLSTDTLYVGSSTIHFMNGGVEIESLNSLDVSNFKINFATVQTNSAQWAIDNTTDSLAALNDVSIPSPVNGQVLTYNSITNKWNAGTPLSASGATGYYGSFYDTTAQTLTSTTQDKRINIAQTYEHNGISIDNNRIVFNYNGVYELIYSIQYKNTDASQHDIYIWLKQNGVDIPNSSSVFTIPARKNTSVPAHLIAVTPFMATLTAGDFIELYWHCNNTAVTVETFTTHANPTIPDTPSVIVAVKQVTNVQIVPTVGAYLPLSGGTVTGVLSTTNVIYANGGNSDQWNSSYTTVNSNSATTWNYQGTDLKTVSSIWQSASLVMQSQSANNTSVYVNVNSNSANWNSSYTTVNSNSANWINSGAGDVNVNSFVYSQSANILSTITTVQVNSATWGTGGGGGGSVSPDDSNLIIGLSIFL